MFDRMHYAERYRETGRVLGKGGSGNVLEAVERESGQEFAVKKVWLKGLEARTVHTLRNEVQILERCAHPNIIRIKDYFVKKQREHGVTQFEELIIVLEKCGLGDLASICEFLEQGESAWPPQTVRKFIVGSLLSALSHVHAHKVIHRDVKLENVFLSDQLEVKLADFGVSRVLEQTLQKVKSYYGTPHYLSPQVIQGADYSSKSDVWSLGVCFYYLVYRRMPFRSQGKLLSLESKILEEEPQFEEAFAEENTIIKQMLTKGEEKRPSSSCLLAQDYFKELQAAQAKKFLAGVARGYQEFRARGEAEDEGEFGQGRLIESGVLARRDSLGTDWPGEEDLSALLRKACSLQVEKDDVS